MKRSVVIASAVAAVLLCLSATCAARARTWAMDVGGHGFQGAPRGFQAATFLPGLLRIHAGDSVRFRIKGGLVHTVTFVPKHQAAPPFILPDSGRPITGLNDASGSPFWFNGQPQLIYAPRSSFRVGPAVVTGRQYLNSGIPRNEARGASYALRFPRVGSYTFVCLVHPGMAGVVQVLPRGRHVPTAAQDAASAKHETRSIVKRATPVAARPVPAKRVNVGETGPGFTSNAMFPRTITVSRGQKITFTMAGQSSLETHTVTFGPETVTSKIERTFATLVPNHFGERIFALNPLATFAGDPPSTRSVYSGANHGNGLLNLGLLDDNPATPIPNTVSATFTTPGTYHYECVIHPNMDGTVIVRP